jgi:hypothetical protein
VQHGERVETPSQLGDHLALREHGGAVQAVESQVLGVVGDRAGPSWLRRTLAAFSPYRRDL